MENRFETLTTQHIIAGLIHNLNTPLNLILGYAQQLQGSYPGDPALQKIVDAGLRIDSQLNGTMQAIHNRLSQKTECFELDNWLKHELSLLMCDLRIKRGISFEQDNIQPQISICNSQLILSLLFQTLILNILELYAPKSIKMKLSIGQEDGSGIINMSYQAPQDHQHDDLSSTLVKGLDQILGAWSESNWNENIKVSITSKPDLTAINLKLKIKDLHG